MWVATTMEQVLVVLCLEVLFLGDPFREALSLGAQSLEAPCLEDPCLEGPCLEAPYLEDRIPPTMPP